MNIVTREVPILVIGGGIGGIAAALALAREGHPVKVLEQARALGEIGAGIQLGPNAFAAFDALGVGERARSKAVHVDRLVMMDAVDGMPVVDMPVGETFRRRFGNPYAVTHRADVHMMLLESALATDRIEFVTSTRIVDIEQNASGATAIDADGNRHNGIALIGCDGGKSAVRQRLIGDAPQVSGHVVYRAVVEAGDFPVDLQWNAPVLWVGPDCHLIHYPVRHGDQYNLVLTFHSDKRETWGVSEGDQEEVMAHFVGIDERPHRLLSLPKSWKRWATADRAPLEQWSIGRATLLGDAAHPMLQYLGQGACMAVEDAVTLGAALRVDRDDLPRAFGHYERSRVARTARAVLSAREFGRLCHAKGVERIVRNNLWKGRTPERLYDALEWLYGWRADTCLAA
ncbi:MAG: 3-hydroxybenzoate 6-monooxygenase [Rhodospirillaceae bacterium]|jgi:2-polyprenyl-6-methoxyphenol hydroxylase-like FAD-dependent oxidoreductase|nr:3-hydroxybenzoate 6-monooxygenase [Rhodospirillaceae bacterium]MEA2913804.1 3-hydroxybenzoate 6-monooxygenase [Bradyrhizobium sp.]